MHRTKLAFAAHAIIETAAGISFIAKPEAQLPGCSPAAKLILRQYGALLLASSLVCVAVITDPDVDGTTRLLALALGSYHFWPCHRAYLRLRNGTSSADEPSALGGPLLHLVVHLACLGLFAYAAASIP
ncbi:hypothetical protein F5Y17DRAFT_234319 [Xylariaceae sp. FL0594]|nr:hypothetical protein F5Y17DRAFT_234319 [Xylariaceae sp. FL0594]